jgi:hypothetical protein
MVTLSDLVKKSEVIVSGHVSTAAESVARPPSKAVPFEVSLVLKGKVTFDKGGIPLCNSHINSEWPDPARFVGEKILFLKRSGDCFSLSHGYKSVIKTEAGRAYAAALSERPHDESLEEFLNNVRTLVLEQTP